MRSLAVLVLSAFLLAPLAAEAGKPKSPFYALVNADGTRAFGNGIYSTRSLYDAVGVYWVYVEDGVRLDVSGCVAVGSPAGGAVGTVSIEPEGSHFAFRITTTLGAGAALFDMPFYIVVHCPKWKRSG